MGSDSAKTHEAFTIAPADPDGEELLDDAGDEPAEPSPDTSTPEGKLAHTTELIAGLFDHTDPEHFYEDLILLVASAHSELDKAGLSGAERQAWKAKIAAAAAGALANLPEDNLHKLAAAQGFAHPTLVSGGALAHWLNPAYPHTSPSQVKIQQKAAERYAQLAAGEVDIVHGHTLADVQAAEASLAPGG